MPDKWITVHPNGEDAEGRKLLLKDGETPAEAMHRAWGVEVKKEKIKIVRETKKALLIQFGGKEAWIQRRWMREDGTLTPAAEKSLQEAETIEEKNKRKEAEAEQRKAGVVKPKADFESEKALGYDVLLDFYDREKTRRHRIFIPKSILQDNGNIPSWFLQKKFDEMDEVYPYQRFGGFNVEYHPFENWRPKRFKQAIYNE